MLLTPRRAYAHQSTFAPAHRIRWHSCGRRLHAICGLRRRQLASKPAASHNRHKPVFTSKPGPCTLCRALAHRWRLRLHHSAQECSGRGPLDITPVIFIADGTPYPLRTVHLAISGVATVNINDALAAAPPSIASHISQYGSAALIYSYPSPGHVTAQVASIDASRSLSFVFPFAESMGEPMRQTVEGLWWKHA